MFERRLEDDLLRGGAGLAGEYAPEVHPIESRPVIHHDHITLVWTDAITGYDHANVEKHLQQGL